MRRWSDVHAELAAAPAGARRTLAPGQVPRPEFEGALRSAGLGAALRHWRFPPDEHHRGLHVLEHADCYVAHLDRVHPDRGLLQHLRHDAPQVVLACGSTAGALVGLRGGLFAASCGSTVGMLIAALLLPRKRAREKARPQ